MYLDYGEDEKSMQIKTPQLDKKISIKTSYSDSSDENEPDASIMLSDKTIIDNVPWRALKCAIKDKSFKDKFVVRATISFLFVLMLMLLFRKNSHYLSKKQNYKR